MRPSNSVAMLISVAVAPAQAVNPVIIQVPAYPAPVASKP